MHALRVWQPRDWLVYARAGVYLTGASLYCTFRLISPTAAIAQWARCSGFMAQVVCLNDQSRGVGLPVEKLNCNIWWYDNFLLPAGLCVVQPCRYCFYSEVQKWIFRPAGATRCPDKREICRPNSTSIGAEMWEYSPQNCQNFKFWTEICTLGATLLQYFYKILSICTRLQVAFKILVWSLSRDKHQSYKHFPAVGAFSHKFSIAPSAKLMIGSKKYGGDRGSRTGCRP